MKRWSPVLTQEFKKNHLKSDLVMIQCNVPMGRNPDLDLIRINNYPDDLNDQDTETIEKDLRNKYGQEPAFDLSVRKYTDPENMLDFLIIFVGQCQQRDQIISEFKTHGIKVNKKNRKLYWRIEEHEEWQQHQEIKGVLTFRRNRY